VQGPSGHIHGAAIGLTALQCLTYGGLTGSVETRRHLTDPTDAYFALAVFAHIAGLAISAQRAGLASTVEVAFVLILDTIDAGGRLAHPSSTDEALAIGPAEAPLARWAETTDPTATIEPGLETVLHPISALAYACPATKIGGTLAVRIRATDDPATGSVDAERLRR